MNLYISDLHLGHANAIKFDERPFADVEEMDRCLIANWNARVSPDDDVYIIGDFCYKSEHTPDWYLAQLKGRKHLVMGNHDGITLKCPEAVKQLVNIDKMMHIKDGINNIHACHFPMAEWNKKMHDSWHIYGHIHGDTGEVFRFMAAQERALNAAACINNYTPVSFDELVRNNEAFKASHLKT